MLTSRERLRRGLRRKIHVHQRLDVVLLEDGSTELMKCSACGGVQRVTHEMPNGERIDMRRFHRVDEHGRRYRQRITGECPHCTRAERDARYPKEGSEQ